MQTLALNPLINNDLLSILCLVRIMVRIMFRFSRNVLNVFAGMDYYYVGQLLRLMIEFVEGVGEGEGSF